MSHHMKQFEHLKIKLEDLKLATSNFSKESFIAGGGFGKVYKGKLAHSQGPKIVAVKRLDRSNGQGDVEFWNEITILSSYQHENIVSLLGYCNESGERILVYEYVTGGSLDQYLKSDKVTWVQRLRISIGVARGLVCLHSQNGPLQRVLHCDIKSSNILLDENWNSKISDFGLANIGNANPQNSVVVTNPVGTIGYCDPVFAETGFLTKESDVYSLGVVLFEILFGRLCTDKPPFLKVVNEFHEQNRIEEIIFGNIKDKINSTSLELFTTIAYQCLKEDREERPLAIHIVRALEAAVHCQMNNIKFSEQPVGILNVKIIKAIDLKKRANTSKNPVWNEKFEFTFDKAPTDRILTLYVYGSSTWLQSFTGWNDFSVSDNYIEISLAEIVNKKHTNKIYQLASSKFGDAGLRVVMNGILARIPQFSTTKVLGVRFFDVKEQQGIDSYIDKAGFLQTGSNQVGFKQLAPVVETGVHRVHDEKRIWFEVELQGAQGDHKAEVLQVNNDDTAVAQRRLKDKQPEEKINTDCLVKEQEKEYQTWWMIKTRIQQQNELVDETNVTLFAKVLHGSEFEVESLGDHTFKVEPQENFNQGAVEKIYAHESLTFNNTVACEVISMWKAPELKADWIARFYNRKLVQTLLEGHSILSLEGILSGDYDVEKNGKWSCIYAVRSHEYQMVCTRLDIASADVIMLDKFDRGLQTNVQVFVDFDYAMGRSITVMGR
ncbi:protein kinase, ATP binding site-containing protein [Tanacetum coccineum]